MDSIYKNWEQDLYIPCKVVCNGKEYTNCEIRLRGDTSREYARKSLKIKFRDDLFENEIETLIITKDLASKSYYLIISGEKGSYIFPIIISK